jgi:hypothetical protein
MAGENIRERRLAGAVGTNQGMDLAGRDLEARACEDRRLAQLDDDVARDEGQRRTVRGRLLGYCRGRRSTWLARCVLIRRGAGRRGMTLRMLLSAAQ